MTRRRRSSDDPEISDGQPDSEEPKLQLIGQEVVPTTPQRSTTVEQGPSASQDRVSERVQQGEEDRNRESEWHLEVVRGIPKAYTPSPPLFTPEQLSALEASQSRAQHIYRTPEAMNLKRPAFLQDELPGGQVRKEEQEDQEGKKDEDSRAEPAIPEVFKMNEEDEMEEQRRQEKEEELMWRWRMGRDLQDAHLHLRAQREENERLKEELKRMMEREFHTPEEDGPRGRQGLLKEDGPRGQKGSLKEDGPRGQKGSSKEDGPRGQKDSSKEDGPRGQQDSKKEDGPSGQQGSVEAKSMEFMRLMMESLKELQRKISDDKDKGSVGGVEIVRTGIDLPKLQEWTPQDAPLRMGDWLALLEPVVADMSTSSEEWWRSMMEEVDRWYSAHMLLSPLARVAHRVDQPAALQERKWQRLEKRMSSLLMMAVPELQREELISAKRMNVFAILTHLQTTYQPGRLGERHNLLKSLEDPPEAQSLQEGVMGLRKWMRWRARGHRA